MNSTPEITIDITSPKNNILVSAILNAIVRIVAEAVAEAVKQAVHIQRAEIERLRVLALAWRSIATVYRDSENGSEMTAAADAIKALDPAGWKDTFAAEPHEVIARMRAMCTDARGEAPTVARSLSPEQIDASRATATAWAGEPDSPTRRAVLATVLPDLPPDEAAADEIDAAVPR